MQTTANLWEVLCRDLEAQRKGLPGNEHHRATRTFKESALQVFPAGSPRLCDALEISGDVCQAGGDLDEAAKDFEDALRRNLQTSRISAAARVAAKLALLLDHLGEVNRARAFYIQALDLFETSHDRSQHCMLLNHLAALEKRTGNIAEAVTRYSEALSEAQRMHGAVHPEVAVAGNNLGVALTEAGDFIKAENEHLRALGIREQLFGALHPEVAQSLANLAVVYHSRCDYDKAEAFYRAALKTYAAHKKDDCPEMQSVRNHMEKLQSDRA